MNQNYLKEFERWTAGPKGAPVKLSAWSSLSTCGRPRRAGELGSTLERLGPPRDAAKAFVVGHDLRPAPLARRIAAAMIDVAIPIVVMLAVVVIGTIIGSEDAGNRLAEFVRDMEQENEPVWGVLQEFRRSECCPRLHVVGRRLDHHGVALRSRPRQGRPRTTCRDRGRHRAVVRSGGRHSPLDAGVLGAAGAIDWAFVLFDPRRQRAVEKLVHTIVVQDEPPELRLDVVARVVA